MNEWYLYPVAVLAGILAGVINTLAGSGSLITLPLLALFFGLSPNTANGTNRIGVLFQTAVALRTMQGRTKLELRSSIDIILAVLFGALLGAWLAVDISEVWMNRSIGMLMLFMFVVLLLKPQQWLRPRDAQTTVRRGPLHWLLFFVIGIYGGFIQAGVGIFLLAAMVLGAGYPLLRSNVVKLFVVGLYSIPVIGIFMFGGKVHWGYGLLLAGGQMIGAWWAARFATGNPRAEIWTRRLLMGIVLASIGKFLGLYELIGRWLDM